MWPFRKKYLYRVVWAYDSQTSYTHTEYVNATCIADAWRQTTKLHFGIDCREITKMESMF